LPQRHKDTKNTTYIVWSFSSKLCVFVSLWQESFMVNGYISRMITRKQNIILQSKHGRPFLADAYYKNDGVKKPVVIFSHGYRGFKDWGPFDLIAQKFAERGLVFVKFNFSHNGTTIEHPTEFADLEAFGNDNITKELDDLSVVIDWVLSSDFVVPESEVDRERLYLLGHSRGGGISILKAREDKRIKKLCTWASVNEVSKYWTDEQLEQIRRDGVIYLPNKRTNQMMPIKWQMYEDYHANLDRLYIPNAVRQFKIPFLIIHGTQDETVPVENAIEMHGWNEASHLFLVEGGNHNFGGKHPWEKPDFTEDMEDVVNETVGFFKER
jgi:pimeloyl-ACP methyl ester carboxylesterase